MAEKPIQPGDELRLMRADPDAPIAQALAWHRQAWNFDGEEDIVHELAHVLLAAGVTPSQGAWLAELYVTNLFQAIHRTVETGAACPTAAELADAHRAPVIKGFAAKVLVAENLQNTLACLLARAASRTEHEILHENHYDRANLMDACRKAGIDVTWRRTSNRTTGWSADNWHYDLLTPDANNLPVAEFFLPSADEAQAVYAKVLPRLTGVIDYIRTNLKGMDMAAVRNHLAAAPCSLLLGPAPAPTASFIMTADKFIP